MQPKNHFNEDRDDKVDNFALLRNSSSCLKNDHLVSATNVVASKDSEELEFHTPSNASFELA